MKPNRTAKTSASPTWQKALESLIFLVGLLLYLVLQTGLVAVPMQHRAVPVETDDAYTYILKAAELRECFTQDCPALNDLRLQLQEPTNDVKNAWIRYREYLRAFVVYHPLHSILLAGLNAAGLTWDQAYNAIVLAGSLLIGFAIAAWLWSLWGRAPAGLALLLLSLSLFPGQGLHYVVPSNLALGIAILAWAVIIQKRSRAIGWVLALLVAMLAMHSTGRLYALVTLGLYYLLADLKKPFWPWRNWITRLSRRQWLLFGLGLLLVALAFLLPILVHRPDMQVRPDPLPPNKMIWDSYRDQLFQALNILQDWLKSQVGWLITGTLLVIGLYSTPAERRRVVLIFLVIIGLLLVTSLIFLLPHYPAEAFMRIWIPFAILLTGLIAQAAWSWMIAVAHWFAGMRSHKRQPFNNPQWILSPYGWNCALLVILGLVFSQLFIIRLQTGSLLIRETAKIMTWKQFIQPDTTQPALLLERGCATVLYHDEVPMHYYFSRGALQCGAVYLPAIKGTPLADEWIKQNPDLQYVVAWNPSVESSLITGGSTLALHPGDRLQVLDTQSAPAQLLLENTGPSQILTVTPLKGDQPAKKYTFKLELPEHSSNWYSLETAPGSTGWLVQMSETGERVLVKGLRTDPGSELFWPWDSGITMNFISADTQISPREIKFETSALAPTPGQPMRILADGGDILLAEIIR